MTVVMPMCGRSTTSSTCRALIIVLAALAASGCEDDQPVHGTSPVAAAPVSGSTITGRERLFWDQQGASLAAVNAFTFTAFVDGAAAGTLSASCTATSDPQSYSCVAPLPVLSVGPHVIAVRTTDGIGQSSSLSSELSVTVQMAPSARSAASYAGIAERALLQLARVCLGEGDTRSCYQLSRVATELSVPQHPTELPGGRLVVVDEGRVLAIEQGEVRPVFVGSQTGASITDVSVPPDAESTREVYMLEVTPTATGRTADVVRLREVNGSLGQRAVIVPGIPLPAVGDPALLVDDGITVAVPRQNEAGDGLGTIQRYDRRGGSAGHKLGTAALAWGPERPSELLRLGEKLAMAGVSPGGMVLGVLGLGQTTPAALPATRQLVASAGVRAIARSGSLVLLAAGDGSAYMSATNKDGELVALQPVDTHGALVTGLATRQNGGIVVTAILPWRDGTPAGRVYELTPVPHSD